MNDTPTPDPAEAALRLPWKYVGLRNVRYDNGVTEQMAAIAVSHENGDWEHIWVRNGDERMARFIVAAALEAEKPIGDEVREALEFVDEWLLRIPEGSYPDAGDYATVPDDIKWEEAGHAHIATIRAALTHQHKEGAQ